ncbi:ABC transporter permease [Mycetocola spongiae]|uniref:ABC transporter permease n=1 Tax=Mycetocola spongiae TaxID=2859226 RepID=UPI001CF1C167|nr:ABC transporter permease subunit [Mycetocola spongiae]UCR87914.1 ABC transporter permease subunit [Mycetocola spongiae]
MSAPSLAPRRGVSIAILAVVGTLFALPLLAMLEFSLRTENGHGFVHWTGLFDPENAFRYRPLFTGITESLILCIVAVIVVLALLLPTMLLVRLRFPRLRRVLELICLIPIAVPAIALVVGLAPVYGVVVRVLGSGGWTLGLVYGVLVLPFASRALESAMQAVDLRTLVEAARSLGAGWLRVFGQILLPNLRRGILAAAFISIAVVLGEYTVASLLNRENLQVAIVSISRTDPYVAVIFSLLALVFVACLLLAIGRIAAPRRRARSKGTR